MARAPETPPVPRQLLVAVIKAFPDRLPEKDYDLRDVDRMVGRQEVVRLLRRWAEKSETL